VYEGTRRDGGNNANGCSNSAIGCVRNGTEELIAEFDGFVCQQVDDVKFQGILPKPAKNLVGNAVPFLGDVE
jgi:hypothetical protein